MAQNLLGVPGHAETAAVVSELADYVDLLEERCVSAGVPTPELQAEIDEEAAHAEETDSGYLEGERPFGGLDVPAMVESFFAAIDSHAERFRKFQGALPFRDLAAIAIAAQLFRFDGADVPHQRVVHLAWFYAGELDAGRPDPALALGRERSGS